MDNEKNIALGERYVRHSEFLEEGEQQRYFDAKVLIAGCGAGSTAAPILARLGIGRDGGLTLADPDVVDFSNLNRQAFDASYVGINKAKALAGIVNSIHPDFNLQAIEEGITYDNVDQLIKNQDVVVDMVDIAKPGIMLALHDSAKRHKKPIVTMYDVGYNVVGYVFDYRDPEQSDLRDFLGLADNTTYEQMDELNPFGIAVQCVIGKVDERFDSVQSARGYYDDLTGDSFQEILPKIPFEMRSPLAKLVKGELEYVPQDVSAAYAAGLLTSMAIRSLIMEKPVLCAPKQIKLDMQTLVKPL